MSLITICTLASLAVVLGGVAAAAAPSGRRCQARTVVAGHKRNLREDEPMTSLKPILALLLVTACAVEHPDAQPPPAQAPKPIRITDAQAEKALVGVELSAPRLCDQSCWDRDPALFTDLDAFRKSECEGSEEASACARAAFENAHDDHGQARDAGQLR